METQTDAYRPPRTTPAFVWLRQPWEHQRAAFERAKDMRDYALFMEMGTGKTFTTINLLRWKCMRAGRMLRTLILCPPIVCQNWKREIEVASKLGDRVFVLRGTAKSRAAEIKLRGWRAGPQGTEFDPQVFVTNFEALQMKDVYDQLTRWRPEVVIIDESQRVKNPKAKRTKLAIKLCDLAKHRYILTGSPILNGELDIWAQFRCLDKGETFDHNFFAFRAHYFIDKNAGMPREKYFPAWVAQPGIESELRRLIYSKASRVLKSECLDLPPLVKDIRQVAMSKEQARCYNEMAAQFIAFLNSKECVARLAITKALRLQQIVSGHFKADDGTVTRFKDNPRLDALMELLEDLAPAHKVIVWAIFQEDAAQIREAVAAAGLQAVELVGGMTAKAQQESIDAFQTDPAVRICIANQQAAGVGINLTASSYSVYFSRNFSLEADLQSESRNYRGGSEIHAKVTRLDLVCPETIDEEILKALYAKENLAEKILNLGGRLTST